MKERALRVTTAAVIAGGALALGAITVHRALARHRVPPPLFLSTQDQSASRSEYLLGVLADAEANIVSRRYESALEKLLWFHENALGIDPASAGVRLSYALSDWCRLGAVYPPALKKLEEVRDRAAENVKSVRTAEEVFEGFCDAAAINAKLLAEDQTHSLFLVLDAEKPEFARKVYRIVKDLLVERKEYRLCGKYLDPTDLIQRLKTLVKVLQDSRLEDAGTPPVTKALLERLATDDCANSIALLVLNDRKDEAAALADKLKKEWNSPKFHAALDEALTGHLREHRGITGPSRDRQ